MRGGRRAGSPTTANAAGSQRRCKTEALGGSACTSGERFPPAHQGAHWARLVAEIQNQGRLPVTMLSCVWKTSAESIGSPLQPLSTSLPHRLGEHDQCLSVIDLRSVMGLINAPNRDPASRDQRAVSPVVQLGNGRTVRGKPIDVPTAASTA